MKYDIDIGELVRLYEDEGLTGREIGAKVGIPHRTIQRYLKDAGATVRNAGHPVIHQLEDRAWLEQRYLGDGKSTTEIAREVGCGTRSVSTWLKRHGLDARGTGSRRGHKRNTVEVRKKMSDAKKGRFLGADNPNWRGGIQQRDPDRGRYRNKQWVKAVKDRDGWKCVECGSNDRPHAHHIKPWRRYPKLRYDITNGVTLCHTCHERVHGRKLAYPLRKHVERPTSASAPAGV